MSQKEVADYLGISQNNIPGMIERGKLEPLYIFNKDSTRKVNLFYKKDIEKYSNDLEVWRKMRTSKNK